MASNKFAKNVNHRGSNKATNAFKAPEDTGANLPAIMIAFFVFLVVGSSLVEIIFNTRGE